MRPRSNVFVSSAMVLLLAVYPVFAQEAAEIAPTGETQRASLLADLEGFSLTRGNAPPWARPAAQRQNAALDVQCNPAKGHLGVQVILDPCEYQGHVYPWCVELPMWGTINGTYRYFGAPETEYALGVPPGSLGDTWMYGTTSALVVFDTSRGELFGQETLVFHYAEPLVFADIVVFTGGTGHYEGATGWMGSVSSLEYPQGNSVTETGFFWGIICTPRE